jgi:hypothetical protein
MHCPSKNVLVIPTSYATASYIMGENFKFPVGESELTANDRERFVDAFRANKLRISLVFTIEEPVAKATPSFTASKDGTDPSVRPRSEVVAEERTIPPLTHEDVYDWNKTGGDTFDQQVESGNQQKLKSIVTTRTARLRESLTYILKKQVTQTCCFLSLGSTGGHSHHGCPVIFSADESWRSLCKHHTGEVLNNRDPRFKRILALQKQHRAVFYKPDDKTDVVPIVVNPDTDTTK